MTTFKNVLEGVRVADFSWIGAAPLASRELALQGATVVKVECHRALDDLRLMGPFRGGRPQLDGSLLFGEFNTGKYSVALDLNRPMAKEVAHRLVSWADIVIENMIPASMAKWGLDYEGCRKIKPDIIYLSSCSEGQYGPNAKLHGFGYQVVGTVGLSNMTGWADRKPILMTNAYSDEIAPFFSIIYLLGALARREATGQGLYIDQAQTESAAAVLGHVYLDCAVNGVSRGRKGNSDDCLAPHAVFPCKDEDTWVAIAVENDDQWRRLCEETANPQWIDDPKFVSMVARKQNEDELNALIGAWTRGLSSDEAMVKLQGKGVPAGAIRSGSGLIADPQLVHRGHYTFLPHKVQGRGIYRSPSYRLSEAPHKMTKASPCLGEDNEFVYRDLLGFTEDEISDMFADGTITTEDDIPHAIGSV